jgi:hypothetical protein
VSIDQYAEGRRRVSRIQARLDETIENLRANPSLSPQGRRAEMARATVDATKLADRLRNETVTARKTERDQLVRHLFGAESASAVMLVRDAQDRAAKIETPEAAATALRQAQLAGDRTLGRAIAHSATTHGWTPVLDAYVSGLDITEQTPVVLSLQKLASLPDGPNTAAADAAVFRVRPPVELGTYRTGDLELIAQEAAPEAPQQLAPSTMVTGAQPVSWRGSGSRPMVPRPERPPTTWAGGHQPTVVSVRRSPRPVHNKPWEPSDAADAASHAHTQRTWGGDPPNQDHSPETHSVCQCV